jgi:hypothetical protein
LAVSVRWHMGGCDRRGKEQRGWFAGRAVLGVQCFSNLLGCMGPAAAVHPACCIVAGLFSRASRHCCRKLAVLQTPSQATACAC